VKTGSIRLRVTVAALAVLVIVIVAFDVALVLALRSSLETDLRTRLIDRAQGALNAWPSVDTRGLALDGVDVEIDKGGTAGQPTAGQATVTVVQQPGLLVAVAHPEGATITLSASTQSIDQTVGRLVELEVGASLVLIVLGAGLLVVVTGRTLRPLRDVADVADRISSGEMGRRLSPTRFDTELGRMAVAFDRMVDALETAAERARTAESATRLFLANASHELRTPIASVHATAETLIRADRTDPDRAILELRLARETARLARLSDDLLSLARLDGHIPVEQVIVDVSSIIDEVVDRQRRLTPTLQVEVDCQSPLLVHGNPADLARAVGNVLENAGHATNGRGHVLISGAASSAETRITIADDGPGVPDGDRGRIFQPFVRLAGAASGGNGLGLAIARAIAREHAGDLTCDAAERGATFSIRLPAAFWSAPQISSDL
jgi:two-component system OmpR family sensor kinase